MRDEKKPASARGIVHRLDPGIPPKAGDVTFSPDYTVTSTTDGGGLVLTNVEVILCFWGSFWSKTPAPSPSSDDYKKAIEGILTGPFMGALNQYRGVGQGTLIHSQINDSTDPANGYTDSDVVTMLTDRLDNTSMPPPTSGHNRFYAVILPVGINNSLTQFAGQHQSFTYKGVKGYYAWVDNTGSLTGHNCVTKVFSHELVEACTNPDVDTTNNSILVNGTKSDGSTVTNDEIGDTCNNEFATVDVNGVKCSMQSYWSKADNVCIIPLGRISFWVDKSTFGRDEVQDIINTQGGLVSNAFWLVLEGYSIDAFNAFGVSIPAPTGSFLGLSGVSVSPTPATPGDPPPASPIAEFEDPTNTTVPQRIRFSYDIKFSGLSAFPALGGSPVFGELDAVVSVGGSNLQGVTALAVFELLGGADPYFTNVDPSNQGDVFYLSQDLRVFSAIAGSTPLPGAPALTTDPYASIQGLIGFLNGSTTYTNPSATDPLNALPGQAGFETGDSSVSPADASHNKRYNFAVARVRLRAKSSSTADNVRVFFRLFVAQSCDTDFQPSTTYKSTLGTSGADLNHPVFPLPSGTGFVDPSGQSIQTIPFFATSAAGTHDYDGTVANANIRTIQIPSGADAVWAYFGCFLDVYDVNNNAKFAGTHHCIIAEIAYDDAPIPTSSPAGATPSPANSDKLAQRNLQITLSENPKSRATHVIPQAFDLRPSRPLAKTSGALLDLPDELMIDWGKTPEGSTAFIYWPQLNAADVLALAGRIYSTRRLSAADANTIQCTVNRGVTYVPIPPANEVNFAGLLTVDLLPTITRGQEFNIIVRRISTRQLDDRRPTPQAVPSPAGSSPPAIIVPRLRNWRQVTGAFQVRIPVTVKSVMLRPEEDTLAILKWRLQEMSPINRWHPVLTRYVSYVAGRVDGLGGDSGSIPPSPSGAPAGQGRPPKPVHGHVREFTGKVAAVVYDRFGDFDGFELRTRSGDEHRFSGCERGMEGLVRRAWAERWLVKVTVKSGSPHWPDSFALLRAPRDNEH